MNIKNLASLLIVTMIFFSCKSINGNKTPGGFHYTIMEKGSGDSVKDKDFVFFTVRVLGDDGSVITENINEDEMPYFQIPKELPSGPMANPIIDMIKLCEAQVGGVYKLVMPMDSMPGARAEYPNLKHFEYVIAIKKIQSEEEFSHHMKEKEAEQAALAEVKKAKLPAILELLESTLSDYKSGKLDVKNTPSGLKYYIVKQGEGENTKEGQFVSADYYGALLDGTKFDESFSRGQEFTFPVGRGQVIKGWDEGFTFLNKGSKAFLFIPSDLAYGEAGSPPVIPSNSELVFYVELNDISER